MRSRMLRGIERVLVAGETSRRKPGNNLTDELIRISTNSAAMVGIRHFPKRHARIAILNSFRMSYGDIAVYSAVDKKHGNLRFPDRSLPERFSGNRIHTSELANTSANFHGWTKQENKSVRSTCRHEKIGPRGRKLSHESWKLATPRQRHTSRAVVQGFAAAARHPSILRSQNELGCWPAYTQTIHC